jgi:uncharacterized protein DUF4282
MGLDDLPTHLTDERGAAMICARCGNAETGDAVYCSNCGASLAPQPPPQSQAAWPAADARAAVAPPPEEPREAGNQDPYQQDYERAKAAGFPRPQQQQQASASPQGFLAALFDFGFNSFVTPKVVKVIYVLIMALTGLGTVGFAITAFRISPAFGIIALLILCPLFFLVEVALWRIVLELFIVVFRIADDLRVIRVRGDLRSDSAAASGISD